MPKQEKGGKAGKEKSASQKAQKQKATGGKAKKKKWSKSKAKDKVVNAVIFDQQNYDKLISEVPKLKMISPSSISEKLHINLSLARLAIKVLKAKNLIKPVGEQNHSQLLYTRSTQVAEK